MKIVPGSIGDVARALVELVVIGGIFASLWYVYPQQTRTVLMQAYSSVRPCTVPLTYRIGTIDPRFGLATSDVESLLSHAADQWNFAANKKVLAYDAVHGIVVIDFVYDYRQNATNAMNAIGTQVRTDTGTYGSLNSQYLSMQSDYLAKKQAYSSALTAFNASQQSYNQLVQSWNTKGGAPEDVFAQLQAQKATLATQRASLNVQVASLNDDVKTLNTLATSINQQIDTLKLNVQKYNTVGAATGSEFEEGLFVSSFAHESITIYQYDTVTRLHRVLAHELGHSLGLEHVTDSQAIMNALNDSPREQLTLADVTELDRACRI